MLADRVKETSTTNGTGDITLAGAVTGFLSFTSQFELRQWFMYWIVSSSNQWENGIGFINIPNNLVRVIVIKNSMGEENKVDFTGTLTVFCNTSSVGLQQPVLGVQGGVLPYIDSGLWTQLETQAITTRHQVLDFNPWLLPFGAIVDGFAIDQIEAGTGEIWLALYSRNGNGSPGKILRKSTAIDATTTGLKVHTFPRLHLQPGFYYQAIYSVNGGRVSGYDNRYTLPAMCGMDNDLNTHNSYATGILSSDFADFPDDAPFSMTRSTRSDVVRVLLRSVL